MSERLAGNAASALSIYLGIATIAKHHVIHLGWLGPPRPGNGLEVRGLQALGGGWDVMGEGRAEGGGRWGCVRCAVLLGRIEYDRTGPGRLVSGRGEEKRIRRDSPTQPEAELRAELEACARL